MKCIEMGLVGHYSQIDMPLLTGGIFSLLRDMSEQTILLSSLASLLRVI